MTLGQNNFSVFNEVNIKRKTLVNINLVLKDISEIPSKFFFSFTLSRGTIKCCQNVNVVREISGKKTKQNKKQNKHEKCI